MRYDDAKDDFGVTPAHEIWPASSPPGMAFVS
jgi:hypothetical protein